MHKHVHMFTDTHIRIQIANIYKYATNAHTYIKQQQQKKKTLYIHTHPSLKQIHNTSFLVIVCLLFISTNKTSLQGFPSQKNKKPFPFFRTAH